MRRFSLPCLLACLLCTPPADADSITLTATQDNTLYFSGTGNVSNAKGSYFFAGLTNIGIQRRALLQFDIAGNIPAGAVIQSATLSLTMSRTIGGDASVSLHRATASWGEGTSHASGEEGTGAPATAGDATWLHRAYNSVTWTTPGGDFDAASVASTIVGAEGAYTWSSAAMTSLVQNWLDQPATNFGWAILGDEENSASAKRFNSREFANPSLVPQLTITFAAAVPEPLTLVLSGLSATVAAVVACLYRRRRQSLQAEVLNQ